MPNAPGYDKIGINVIKAKKFYLSTPLEFTENNVEIFLLMWDVKGQMILCENL